MVHGRDSMDSVTRRKIVGCRRGKLATLNDRTVNMANTHAGGAGTGAGRPEVQAGHPSGAGPERGVTQPHHHEVARAVVAYQKAVICLYGGIPSKKRKPGRPSVQKSFLVSAGVWGTVEGIGVKLLKDTSAQGSLVGKGLARNRRCPF